MLRFAHLTHISLSPALVHCEVFDKSAPLWREAQRKFEELNGAKHAAELQRRRNGVVTGGVTADTTED